MKRILFSAAIVALCLAPAAAQAPPPVFVELPDTRACFESTDFMNFLLEKEFSPVGGGKLSSRDAALKAMLALRTDGGWVMFTVVNEDVMCILLSGIEWETIALADPVSTEPRIAPPSAYQHNVGF